MSTDGWTDLGPRKRAACPACLADVSLRRHGELREHPDHRHEMYGVPGAVQDGTIPVCPAAGHKPEEWKEAT